MGQSLKIDVSTSQQLSLDLPDGLTVEECRMVARQIYAAETVINWKKGDWWNYVVKTHGEDTARQLAEETWGMKPETGRNYGWVASKFSAVERSTKLSFTHYLEAAALPPEVAGPLLEKAERDGLPTRWVSGEVQAIKAANDAPIGMVSAAAPSERKPKPEWPAIDILATKYVEAMEEISSLREMTKGEADFWAMIEQCLRQEYSSRDPVPDDFEIVFVQKGRIACEQFWGGRSRITISRWLHQSGYSRLISERANFVKYQRDQQRAAEEAHKPVTSEADRFLPVATMAADFLRTNRYGGWRISRQASGWIVGTVHRSSEELIAMAERQGFDREAAVTEARQEGY